MEGRLAIFGDIADDLGREMRGFIAPTDLGWYQFLRARPELDEVNFWRPKPDRFRALQPGEPFFFKLKAPHNKICGFGLFTRFAALPLWQAWDVFGLANGAADQYELAHTVTGLSAPAAAATGGLDRVIGCIGVAQPVFFPPDEWVDTPRDWSRGIQRGRRYPLQDGEGRRLWEACLEQAARVSTATTWTTEAIELRRRGQPYLVRPRLGQSSFRLAVLDAYEGACAVTTEHSIPVLEAAHIKPWNAGGAHDVSNGILLRRDLHRLLDLGYVTVRPDLRFAVSPALKETYANGRTYYALDGHSIGVPADPAARPSRELLEWHGDEVFRAA